MVANKFISFGLIQNGYFLFQGQLYFAQWHGEQLFYFEVNEGIISDFKSDFVIYPDDRVELISPQNFVYYDLPAVWES